MTPSRLNIPNNSKVRVIIMRNNRGFTLVEVLASIIILGILATVFFQMFIFSQKTTTSNQEKLVAVNVAQGMLERIKHDVKLDEPYRMYPEITSTGTYTISNCGVYSGTDKTDCEKRYKTMVNDINYTIEIQIKVADEAESGMGLYWAIVRVLNNEGKPQSTAKGFVEL
jgi:prepilin-type N-terminal cleavage/methylation domain-containing protein